jgi:hypothetical protein
MGSGRTRKLRGVYQEQTGVEYTEEQVREYAADLDESGFFYKTALELNVTAVQKLTDQRHRRTKRKVDLALISFPAWNPDSFLTKLHDAVGFIYTKWFTLLALVMFAIMTSILWAGGMRSGGTPFSIMTSPTKGLGIWQSSGFYSAH